MRTFLAVLAIVIAASHSPAAVGDWKAYSRFVVTELAAAEREVWAATVGGITRSDLTTGAARTYTPTEGLPDQRIYCAVYDSERHTAWFGSEDGGLIQFLSSPGLTEPVLQDPLLMGQVTAITGLAIHDEMLYLGHSTGVTVLDLTTRRVIETYHQVGPDFAYRNERIEALSITGGMIYVAHDRGISYASLDAELLVPGSWTVMQGDVFDGTSGVVTFLGSTFVGAHAGLLKLREGAPLRVGIDRQVTDVEVFDDALWVATTGGLYVSTDGETFTIAAGLTDRVSALSRVDGVMLVAATANGTYKLTSRETSTGEKVPGVDFPPSERFASIAVDTSGAVWVAPKDVTQGVFWFEGNTWNQLLPGDYGLPGVPDPSGYISVVVDERNRVWAGSWGAGVAVIDRTGGEPQITALNHASADLLGLAAARHFVVAPTLLPDPPGAVWVGAFHGLAFSIPSDLDSPANQILAAEMANGEVNDHYGVRALALDDYDVLWIGSSPGDLGASFSPGIVLYYTAGTPLDLSDDRFVAALGVEGVDSNPGLLSADVNAIDVDSDGTVWVGTDNGLTSFEGRYDEATNTYSLSSRHYTTNMGLPGKRVTAVVCDSRNYKWIGTNEGLAQISPSGKIVAFSRSNLVDPTGNIVSLAMDEERGYLWIGTMAGLNRYEAYRPRSGDEGPTARPLRNPYELEMTLQGTNYVLTGEPLTIQVSPGARIRIYTVTGELVWEARDDGSGRVTWNGRTMHGNNPVASGVYLYDAELDGQHSLGKIAVVRTGR